MGADKWSKFWWQDWQNDLALKSCSYAARGLWMDMLAIMHEAENYGHLEVAGTPVSGRQLAGLTNGSEREVKGLIEELRKNKVFSVTDDGVIYSRRMLRDRAARDQAKEYGRQGGNPNLKPETSEGVNGSGNGGVNPPNKPRDKATHNLQEARSKKLESKVPTTSAADEPQPVEMDARKRLWGEGVQTLRRITGKPDGKVRALLGLMLRMLNDDCAKAMLLIQEAEALDAADPAAWLIAAVKPKARMTAAERMEASYRSVAERIAAMDEAEASDGRLLLQ